MNTLKNHCTMIFAFVVLATLGLSFTGCAGHRSYESTLKTFESVGESVNSAMNLYGDLYRANALTPAQVQSVRSKHAEFQKAYNAAFRLAQKDLSALSPVEVSDLAFELVILINQFKEKPSLQ